MPDRIARGIQVEPDIADNAAGESWPRVLQQVALQTRQWGSTDIVDGSQQVDIGKAEIVELVKGELVSGQEIFGRMKCSHTMQAGA